MYYIPKSKFNKRRPTVRRTNQMNGRGFEPLFPTGNQNGCLRQDSNLRPDELTYVRTLAISAELRRQTKKGIPISVKRIV